MRHLTISLILGLCFQLAQGNEGRVVTVATLEFSPYVSAHLPNNGWAWEVVERAFAHQGYQAELRIVPWARAVELTKAGMVDALYMANKNPEREEWALFSLPVGEELSVAFKHVDSEVAFHTLADLKQYSVIGLRSAHVVRKVREAGVVVDDVNSIEQGIRMLFFKRADVLITDRYVANYMLKHEFPEAYQSAIEFIKTPVDVNQLHLAVSRAVPDHETLTVQFNTGLQAIIEDGTYQQILEKHGFDE